MGKQGGYRVRSAGWNYDPTGAKKFRLSRSKLDLSLECPRCFWLDARQGIKRPEFPSFTLNSAVDALLKDEFDVHRRAQTRHPYCEAAGIDAVPFQHPDMDAWRDSLRRGVTFDLPGTNLTICGGLDDVWMAPGGTLHVVDYKATAKTIAPTLDGFYQQGYKRQAEVYQWLLRRNGHEVSDRAYFVYANGDGTRGTFGDALHFSVEVIPYDGNDSWVEEAARAAYTILQSNVAPPDRADCEHCGYRREAGRVLSAAPQATARTLPLGGDVEKG